MAISGQVAALTLWLTLLGACASTPSRGPMATYDFRPAPPDSVPVVMARGAELIPYPEIDVTFVHLAGSNEIYHCRGLFYCFHEGHWFFAHSLSGEWTYIEMKQVPRDLYRVRGAQPPVAAAERINLPEPTSESDVRDPAVRR